MKKTLQWTMSAGFALASGLTGFGHIAIAASSEASPTITIHMRNYAGVEPKTLTEAEEVAKGIFRKAGLETRWADIVLTGENIPSNFVEYPGYRLADIQLSILPQEMSDRSGLPNNVLGLAPGTGPDRGIVYVLDSKVRALYWRMSKVYINGGTDRYVSLSLVLGHVIAHEIGHLLLNQQVHSLIGIMRGEWGFADFRDMTCGMLLFTPKQAENLRADALRRNTRQEAVGVPTLESPALQAQSEIRFRLIRDSIIVVSMMAEKEGPFDFVLDTGADTTIVDASLASRLSLAPLRRVRQTTLAGAQTLTVSSLNILKAGPAQVENLPVLVQELAVLRNMDPQIVGIAGQDFLSHFNYLIDYRKHSVRFEQGNEIRSSIQGDPVQIELSGNRMIIASAVQSVGRVNLHFLLDSGANSIVLLPGASQALNLPIHANRLEATSSGQAEVKVGRIRLLTVGSQQFHDLDVALTATEPTQRIGDGLLPTALFKSLYVNNYEGFVVFNPQSRKK